MPLFLDRDDSIRRFSVLPEGMNTFLYMDRHQRKVHALLEARQKATLLAAQATPTSPHRHRAPQARSARPPLAA